MPTTLLTAAIALAVPLGAVAAAFAQDRLSDWRGRPSIEFTRPDIEQTSTLRVVRSSGSATETIEDQETILGWGSAAVQGKVKPREESLDHEETIEIMRRKDTREALQRK
jgi:hypothetical protein